MTSEPSNHRAIKFYIFHWLHHSLSQKSKHLLNAKDFKNGPASEHCDQRMHLVVFKDMFSLNFRKFKVALNPLRRIFLNFAKSCILSCWLQFDNKKWGSPSSFFSYKRLKLKLRLFLAGHIVTMVTFWATILTATCSPMIGQFVNTMILASTGIEWL